MGDNDNKLVFYISPQLDEAQVNRLRSRIAAIFEKPFELKIYTQMPQYKLGISGVGSVYSPQKTNLEALASSFQKNTNLATYLRNTSLLSSDEEVQKGLGENNQNLQETAELTYLSAANLQKMAAQTKVMRLYTSNAVNSFWSVWSLTWAIRGGLQDIFGFSKKWTREVNNITRVVQSGLYLYAGTERILKGIGQRMLLNNAEYEQYLAFLRKAQVVNVNIAKEQALLLKMQKDKTRYTKEQIKDQQALLAGLRAEKAEHMANAMAHKQLAEENTYEARASLMSIGMKVSLYAALAMAIIGAIRWWVHFRQEEEAAQKKAEDLRHELTALGTTNIYLKSSFTSLSSMIDKLSGQFEDFKNKISTISSPTTQFAMALREVAEQTAKLNQETQNAVKFIDTEKKHYYGSVMGAFGEFATTTKPTLEQSRRAIIQQSWEKLFNGGQDQNALARAWWDEVFRNRNKTITEAFKTPESLQKYYNEHREEMINELVKQRVESLKRYHISQSEINRDMNRFNIEAAQYIDNMVQMALKATQFQDALSGIDVQLAKQYQQLAQNNSQYAQQANVFTQIAIFNIDQQIKAVEQKLRQFTMQTPSDIIKQTQEEYAQLLVAKQSLQQGIDKATTKQAVDNFYQQMYEAYATAAKTQPQYQQLANYWKQQYINHLKNIIRLDLQELKTLQEGTDLWKQKQLEIAKSRAELAKMLEISQKLNATWWNIPTAVIRPTKAQLTSTALLQPTFHIYGNTVEELTKKVKETLQDFVISEETNTGTIGGAT